MPVTMIGGDGGLLERPVDQRALTLAPGQRADLLLDLTGLGPGTDVHLDSLAFPEADAGRVGMMRNTSPLPNGAPLRLMTLRVRARKGSAFAVPQRLSTYEAAWSADAEATLRRVPLRFQRMRWLLGGRVFAMDDVAADATVAGGSTHVWEFVSQPNGMGMEMAHPLHLHGRQFRVLSRTGRRPNALREGIADARTRRIHRG